MKININNSAWNICLEIKVINLWIMTLKHDYLFYMTSIFAWSRFFSMLSLLRHIIQCAQFPKSIQNYVINTHMDEQGDIRTRESIEKKSWSDESLTYYYSKFELFENTNEINQFYLYSLFVEKVSNELGKQWREEANALSPFFNNRQIFMNLLSIWLHLHPVVNCLGQDSQIRTKIPVFNQSYLDQFSKRLRNSYPEKRQEKDPLELSINSTSSKALCMGFFLTANQIWEEMFRQPQKQEPKPSWVYKSVSKTIQQSFKPLMVVTQTIGHLIGRKRVKTEQKNQEKNIEQEMFGDCYLEFRRTVDLEKQIERKLSDFCLDEDEKLEPSQLNESHKVVTKDQFNEEQAPLENNMLGNLYEYVTKFLKKRSSWQVASSFVTNILDLKHQQHVAKVKVLRPAQDFYEKLLLSWIMLIKTKQINFDRYIENVKITFARSWRSKYIVPCKYFYDKLTKSWIQMQKQMEIELNEKQMMEILIKKIRQSMKQDWQRKIKIQKRDKKDY